MKISIAMTTYNGGRYLPAQLESFVAQTRQPDELIVTDDCSSDNTMEILRDFAEKAPFPVKFSQNERNLGYAGNFNAALMQTSGDLVFLSDQDDVWFPEKLAEVEQLALAHPEKWAIINDVALTDGELRESGVTKLGQIRSLGLPDHEFVMGCSVAVRRELLDVVLPVPEGYKSHDAWIMNFAYGLDVCLIHEKVLQYYRRHGKNESVYIANRTERVSKGTMFLERIRSRFGKAGDAELEFSLNQLEMYASGVRRVVKATNSPKWAHQTIKESAKKLEISVGEDLAFLRARKSVRGMSLLPRTSAVLKHYRSGDYSRALGLQSALRDIMGAAKRDGATR